METIITRLVIGLVLAILLAAPADAGIGDLDTTFGVNGLLRYPVGFSGVAGLPDGRLQLVAVTGGNLQVLRLANGRPDPTYGTAGVLTTSIPGGLPTTLNAAYVQGDGSAFLSLQGGGSSIWLMKIDPSGRPDTNFGPNGLREIPRSTTFANDIAYIESVAVAPSGAVNMLINYFPDLYECSDAMTIVRLGANGEPDLAFGDRAAKAIQFIDGCNWGGVIPMVALSGDRLLLGQHGILQDGHDGMLALPAPLQTWLENRRLLKIEDTGEFLYFLAATAVPTKPGLDLSVSRWRRDLTLDTAFGSSGTGYVDISLNDIAFIPLADFVAVTLLPPQTGASHMYLNVLAYGHKVGGEGASEHASLAYRLQPDGSLDAQFGTGGLEAANSIWMNFLQQSPDGSLVADIGYGVTVRLSGSSIESPGIVSAQFSCSATNLYSELGGTATIAVSRILGTQGAVSVKYWTQALTATPGVDYSDVQGTLSWADGESGVKSINVPIFDDAIFEPEEQFLLNLERVNSAGPELICPKGVFAISSNESYPGSAGSPGSPVVPATPVYRTVAAPTAGGGVFDGVTCALLGLLLMARSGSRNGFIRPQNRSSL